MSITRHIAWALAVAAVLISAGCGTRPLSTEAVEERFLNQGYANRMYNYGETLYAAGRFSEAHSAFLASELAAYTEALRDSARSHRIYLEVLIASLERDRQAPQPPYYEPPKPPPPEEAQVRPITADQEAVVQTGEPLENVQTAPQFTAAPPPRREEPWGPRSSDQEKTAAQLGLPTPPPAPNTSLDSQAARKGWQKLN